MKWGAKFFRTLVEAGLAVFLLCTAASAQTSRGTLSGIVRDPQGAALVNTEVELVNDATGVQRATRTNEAGLYRFDALEPGAYSLSAKAAGFRAFSKRAIPVAAAAVATVDIALEVGDVSSVVEVVAQTEAVLQYESPVRASAFGTQSLRELPIQLRNPVSLALTVPGVSSSRFGIGSGGLWGRFSVNGQRGRSNNFMIDGTDNNDISVAGESFQIINPDAVQQVSVQTTNYDAEFGRAGGAVINIITKSGTNEFHGSANFLLDVTNDDAITSSVSSAPAIQQRGKLPQGTEQWYGGTVGGRIIRNKTFFFAGYQRNRRFSTSTNNLFAPSEAGWQTLNRLFPQGANPRVDIYRQIVGPVRATANLRPEPLGLGRPDVELGTAVGAFASTFNQNEVLARIDHTLSERDQLTGRFMISDSSSPKQNGAPFFPGYGVTSGFRAHNVTVQETHTFSPAMTNELRLAYNRQALNSKDDVDHPLGLSIPRIAIAGNLTAFGLAGTFPQGRTANNYQLQDTVSRVVGAHTFRFGADLLQQRSGQFAPANFRGSLNYNNAGGFNGLANYIDDFGGSASAGGGNAARDFGSARYYPDMFRSQLFFQDRWRATTDLTLTFGLRHEYLGQPMNVINTPAYTGLFNIDPVTFDGPYNKPNRVKGDFNNWSPSAGLAWSPSLRDGWAGRIFGQKKSVIRAGYQIGYESYFNNITSNAQTSTPNLVSTSVTSTPTADSPRGLANLSRMVPGVARPPRPNDDQTLMVADLVNPYVQKWSFGVQREIAGSLLVDVSYVGAKGTRLFINEDLNPAVPANLRIVPAAAAAIPRDRLTNNLDALQGARTIRTNGGSSIYHGLQAGVNRRFTNGLMFGVSYAWSKNIDNASEIFAPGGINSSSLAAVPSVFGGQAAERGLSTLHRDQRLVFQYLYELPVFRGQRGLLGKALGGWQFAGITTFETGVPFNIVNGADADGLGGAGDRPLFNPSGRKNVRAQPSAASPTGFIDPDAGRVPIDPAQAQYIGLGANTTAGRLTTGNLGRNTALTPGINNWDLALTKAVKLGERWSLQFRAESFNLANHPQYGYPSISNFTPGAGSFGGSVMTTAPGSFLTTSLSDGGGRVMKYQLRLLF